MNQDFSTKFTAWSFIAAALMMWGGWMLIPVDVGPYVKPDDFAIVDASRYLFVWSYRFYFFGVVFSVIAVTALAALMSVNSSRAVIWPGAAVAAGGAFSCALGAAYYYHHGYWGSLELLSATNTLTPQAYVDDIRRDGEYVTCLMRFGRVFGGLGLAIYGLALLKWRPVSAWLGWVGLLIGIAAIAVTMPSGENFWVYQPVFHLHALWMAVLGFVILRKGVRLDPGA